jgi:regulator of sigma E protease
MDIVIFVLALSILILVHEFGHFFAAKKSGVKVEEFGMGLPPRIVGKKIGETIYSLNWLPIGGFVRMFGEEKREKSKRAFNNISPTRKIVIVMGGVVMNLVLAIVIFGLVYKITGIPVEIDKVKVEEVAKNSPAEMAGIKVNDLILKVEEEKVKTPKELTEKVLKFKGKDVVLTIESDNQEKVVDLEVRENPPKGEGSMGVVITNVEMKKIGWGQFYLGIGEGFKEAFFWGKMILEGLVKMVANLIGGQVPKDVAGPIGMYQATSTIKKNQGLLGVMHFFGIISVNLAVVNALPLPALDGGRLVFVLIELIFKKKVDEDFENKINTIGMFFLLSLIALITIGDVMRLIK